MLIVDNPAIPNSPGVGDTTVFQQIGLLSPFPVDQQLVATLSFTAFGVGTADFSWVTNNVSFPGENLHFFGLTDAPGASVTIVPEPGTAALLALGVLGLALRSRRT